MNIQAISHILLDGKMIDPGSKREVADKVGIHLIQSGSAVEVAKETGDTAKGQVKDKGK